MSSFSISLEDVRRHNSVVEKIEFALKNDPQNDKLRLGLGSAKRRALESQKILESYASANQIDLISYRIENEEKFYAVKSVADSISHFQSSFTGIVDFLENGPKERSRFSNEIVKETALEFAYTFPGSLGVVFAVKNDRDLLAGKFDKAADVLRDFLEINDNNSAVDASRYMGLSLVSQLCSWVEINSNCKNSIDYIWKRSDGIVRGERISQNRFHEINDIFQNAREEETRVLNIQGVLLGLDLEASFHFVVPNGEAYRGKLSDEFVKLPTMVGKRYVAKISAKENRKIATGVTSTTYKLLNLTSLED